MTRISEDSEKVFRLCFDEPRELSQGEIAQLKIESLPFNTQGSADFNGDGLADSAVVGMASEKVDGSKKEIGQIILLQNELGLRKPLKNNEIDSVDRRHSLLVAFKDINRDKKPDLIVQRQDPHAKGKVSYQAYMNLNAVDSPASQPALFNVFVDDPEKGSMSLLNSAYLYAKKARGPQQLKTNVPIDAVFFHPGNAFFVSINEGPLTLLERDKTFILDSMGYSVFLLDPSSTVHFFGKSGNKLGSFQIFHPPRDYTIQRNKGGVEWITVKLMANDSNPPISDKELDEIEDLLHPQLEELKKMWGETLVNTALKKIIFLRGNVKESDGHSDSARAESWRVKDGAVFISWDLYQQDLLFRDLIKENLLSYEIAQAIVHETAHNLEKLFRNGGENPVLSKLWEQLTDDCSLVFDFLREKNFFNGKVTGGHPEDDAQELFASLVVDLTAGVDCFRESLARWDSSHPSLADRQNLREDFKRLLCALHGLSLRFHNSYLAEYLDSFMALLQEDPL